MSWRAREMEGKGEETEGRKKAWRRGRQAGSGEVGWQAGKRKEVTEEKGREGRTAREEGRLVGRKV